MIGIPFPFGGKSSSMANPYVKEPRELVPVVWCAHAECHRAFAQALTRGEVGRNECIQRASVVWWKAPGHRLTHAWEAWPHSESISTICGSAMSPIGADRLMHREILLAALKGIDSKGTCAACLKKRKNALTFLELFQHAPGLGGEDLPPWVRMENFFSRCHHEQLLYRDVKACADVRSLHAFMVESPLLMHTTQVHWLLRRIGKLLEKRVADPDFLLRAHVTKGAKKSIGKAMTLDDVHTLLVALDSWTESVGASFSDGVDDDDEAASSPA